MRSFSILVFAYLAYFSAAIIVLENTPRNVTLEFEQFEQEYNKHYLTPAEREARLFSQPAIQAQCTPTPQRHCVALPAFAAGTLYNLRQEHGTCGGSQRRGARGLWRHEIRRLDAR
jgi:hypothetical protein